MIGPHDMKRKLDSPMNFRNRYNFPNSHLSERSDDWLILNMRPSLAEYDLEFLNSGLSKLTVEKKDGKIYFILDYKPGFGVSIKEWRKEWHNLPPIAGESELHYDYPAGYGRIMTWNLDFSRPDSIEILFSKFKAINSAIPKEIIEDVKYYLIASQVHNFLERLKKENFEEALNELQPCMVSGVPSPYVMAAEYCRNNDMPIEAITLLNIQHHGYNAAVELKAQLMKDLKEHSVVNNRNLKLENEQVGKEIERLREKQFAAAQSAVPAASQPNPVLFSAPVSDNTTSVLPAPAAPAPALHLCLYLRNRPVLPAPAVPAVPAAPAPALHLRLHLRKDPQ